MSTERRFDFTSETIPSSWHEAATHAPEGTKTPLRREAPMRAVPTNDALDLFTAGLSALVTCIIAVSLWYEIDGQTNVSTSWGALALGTAVALAIRFGGGEQDHQVRAVLSLVFYVGALLVALYIIGAANHYELYGSSGDPFDFERELLNTRITRPWAVVAWSGGALATVLISYALRRRN
ncbi:MAG: hypothetical protein OEV40_08715 [Acidimicrobiia bacterium]|nr:hypothetical protein [Acidimicrobiia bacterium]